MNFNYLILSYFDKNKRDLPWRDTKDPFRIWLSEIILQQTRVDQGMKFYNNFINEFETIFDLANADEQKVLKLWQGLGYYSRARNLHFTAQHIVNDLEGVFPNNFQDLKKLKGVGDYTAAAIASIVNHEAVPAIDGNMFRVFARYFNIKDDISLPKTKKIFWELGLELIDKNRPGDFNQAIMEFGALQCVPKSPNCSTCVFNESCAALQKKKVDQLPIKSKKLKVRNRYFNYIVASDENENTIIQKRTSKGIWHNLYEFPLLETEKEENFDFVSEQIQNEYFKENNISSILETTDKSIVHKLSHQHLHIKFWKVSLNGTIKEGITYEKLKTFPFPIVIHNYIEREQNNKALLK